MRFFHQYLGVLFNYFSTLKDYDSFHACALIQKATQHKSEVLLKNVSGVKEKKILKVSINKIANFIPIVKNNILIFI